MSVNHLALTPGMLHERINRLIPDLPLSIFDGVPLQMNFRGEHPALAGDCVGKSWLRRNLVHTNRRPENAPAASRDLIKPRPGIRCMAEMNR
jgi:hypothetical protein